MAGKSNKARNKKAAQVAASAAGTVVGVQCESVIPEEATPVMDVVHEEAPKVDESDDTVAVEGEAVTASVEANEGGGVSAESQVKQGDKKLLFEDLHRHYYAILSCLTF